MQKSIYSVFLCYFLYPLLFVLVRIIIPEVSNFFKVNYYVRKLVVFQFYSCPDCDLAASSFI